MKIVCFKLKGILLDQKGSALLVVIMLFLALMTSLSLSTNLLILGKKLSSDYQQQLISSNLAESAIVYGNYILKKGGGKIDKQGKSINKEIGNYNGKQGYFRVEISRSSGNSYTVIGVGGLKGARLNTEEIKFRVVHNM
ncbi:MAG: hypothetical protein V1872_08425 [bacterium]